MLNSNQLSHVLIGMKSAVVVIAVLKGVEGGRAIGRVGMLCNDYEYYASVNNLTTN